MITGGFLFSGIGGMEIGAIKAGITPIWSNDNDKFCCQVLRKNFSHKIIHEDIKKIRYGEGYKEQLQSVDILAGGFPCQPVSVSGKRRGKKDSRYLWPEMFRVGRELKPKVVLIENVTGLLSMEDGQLFETICTDLESEGYTVEPFIIPAGAVGASHRRNRVWIIAYLDCLVKSSVNTCNNPGQEKKTTIPAENKGRAQKTIFDRGLFNLSYGGWINTDFEKWENSFFGIEEKDSGELYIVRNRKRTIYTPLFLRKYDGFPRRVDRRSKRIETLGNAVQPQLAYIIFKSILSTLNFQQ